MRAMKIEGRSGTCTILIGESIRNVPEYTQGSRCIIVTDGTVRKLHGGHFPPGEVIEIGEGEGIKNLETVGQIYDRLLGMEADRSTMLIGIGGGIVCDVTGFVAATYLRGIPCGLVPTTLLAQVDAAMGGKNGVNLKGYKNLVGTIRQPRFVLCDPEMLRTLPTRELRCGMAEIIKQATIADEKPFAYLEEKMGAALSLQRAALEKVVHDAIAVKAGVVSRDENEQEERRKLNFGHTVGHAIEKTAGLPHGEAVAVGMAIAARLSVKKGILPAEECRRLERLLQKAGLPVRLELDGAAVLDAVRKDKKRQSEKIRMVLLEGIGKAKLVDVSLNELEGIIHEC